MDFSDALRAIKSGKRVTRTGWNGNGMWLFLIPGSRFPVERGRPMALAAPEMVGNLVSYRSHIDLFTADGEFVPWCATQSDLLAEDWETV
jgi:hypothetical protein